MYICTMHLADVILYRMEGWVPPSLEGGGAGRGEACREGVKGKGFTFVVS
jgi:hypothetical protein